MGSGVGTSTCIGDSNLGSFVLGCIDADFRNSGFYQNFSRSERFYKIDTLLHFWNPIWKTRKAPLQSVTRARNNAPAKRPANRNDQARPGRRGMKNVQSAFFSICASENCTALRTQQLHFFASLCRGQPQLHRGPDGPRVPRRHGLALRRALEEVRRGGRPPAWAWCVCENQMKSNKYT